MTMTAEAFSYIPSAEYQYVKRAWLHLPQPQQTTRLAQRYISGHHTVLIACLNANEQ